MSYPHNPDGPKPSNFSTTSSATDPFNAPPMNYEGGGGGAAPPQGGGYYYDNESDMGARYEGGGMGRETWTSESAWSGNGEWEPKAVWWRKGMWETDQIADQNNYPSSEASHQQGYPSRSSTPTYTEGSREGHRTHEPYVRYTC